MSETVKGLLVILAGGAVMLYFLISFLGGKSRNSRLFDRARKNGWSVTGYLVKGRRAAGGRSRGNRIHEYKWDEYVSTYQYTINGKTYRIRQRTRRGDYEHGANSIQVFYDPKHPRRVVTRSTVSAGRGSWLLAMVLTLLTMFVTAQVLERLF